MHRATRQCREIVMIVRGSLLKQCNPIRTAQRVYNRRTSPTSSIQTAGCRGLLPSALMYCAGRGQAARIQPVGVGSSSEQQRMKVKWTTPAPTGQQDKPNFAPTPLSQRPGSQYAACVGDTSRRPPLTRHLPGA